MAEIREGWLFDGFRVYRIRDTRELEAPFEHRSFTEEALRLFGVRWTKPRVPLENWSALLSALAPSKGLVVIHREHSSPHTAQIGIVTGVDGRSVTLHEIDPSAEFEDAQSTYRLAEITSIGWGGLYENALHAVWGKRHSKPARVRRRRSMP
jgi:hypothetical protein